MLNEIAIKYVAACARSIRARGENDVQEVPSPCMSVCQMDAATGWCEGCLRTLEEIGQWGNASHAVKRSVWLSIEERIASTQS